MIAALLALLALEPLLAGDAHHARDLWKLHCAACHGESGEPTEVGRKLNAPALRDPALLQSVSDDALVALLHDGTAAHPAPGAALSLLDAADLVAFLRGGLPTIRDVIPDAAAYTAKRYELPAPALVRAGTLAGSDLSADESRIVLFSVYGGEQPPTGPRLVPQDPVQLDALSPQAKKGYVAYGWLGAQPVALALAPDFTVLRLLSRSPDAARAAPAVVGKGGDVSRRRPFVSKAAPEAARVLTRLYARAVEAAALAAREETERHLFDMPARKSP